MTRIWMILGFVFFLQGCAGHEWVGVGDVEGAELDCHTKIESDYRLPDPQTSYEKSRAHGATIIIENTPHLFAALILCMKEKGYKYQKNKEKPPTEDVFLEFVFMLYNPSNSDITRSYNALH